MSLRTFFFAQLFLGLLACQLPPVADPDPGPELRVERDEFDQFSTLFKVAENPSSLVWFDTLGHVVLNSSRGSGWIYSDSFKLPGLTIEVGLTQVSEDWCLEFSDEVFNMSEDGLYLNRTRCRAYIYDPDHKLFVEYKKLGETVEYQVLEGERSPVPARIRLRFTADSMFYDCFMSNWKTVFAMKESFQDTWYFALTSVGSKGTTKVDYVQITAPAESFPQEPEYGLATLEWDKNPESDIASYIAEAVGFANARTVNTFYTFVNLPKSKAVIFRVAAEDSSGNRSAWSDTLVHKIQ